MTRSKQFLIAVGLSFAAATANADPRGPLMFGPVLCDNCGVPTGGTRVLGMPPPDSYTKTRLDQERRRLADEPDGFNRSDKIKICNESQCVTYEDTGDFQWNGSTLEPRVGVGQGGHDNTGNNAGGPPPGNIADNRWGWACGTVEAGGGTIRNCFVTP